MIKRLSVIGKGTVGCLTSLYFSNRGYDIDWYCDPNQPALSVGEGTDLYVPKFLDNELDLTHQDIINLGGYYKFGIEKVNWGKETFTHTFPLNNVSWHINANNLQNYITDHIKDKVNIINKKVEHKEINNFIIDCSGKPSNISELEQTPIPVNKSFIVQCLWDKPKFNKTICIAQNHGWVFLIPLQDRCSVGYLYNSHYSTPNDISAEIKNILKNYNLSPSSDNTIEFSNYYRKENFNEGIAYNGNASFFLEPMEATSLSTSIKIISQIHRMLSEGDIPNENNKYKLHLEETVDIIMLHYLIDPPIKNKFWEYANSEANKWFSNRFKTYPKIRLISNSSRINYSTWFEKSFKQNIKGLNIQEKLKSFTW